MQVTFFFTILQKTTQIQRKNLLQQTEFSDFYRQNKPKNLLRFGRNSKMELQMKQNLQNRWTGLNHYCKTPQTTAEPGQNTMYRIKQFTRRKRQLKTVQH